MKSPRLRRLLFALLMLTAFVGCTTARPPIVRAQSDLPEDRYERSRYDDSDPYDGALFRSAVGGRPDPRLKEVEERNRRAKEAWQRGEWLPDDAPAPPEEPLPGESVESAPSGPAVAKPAEPIGRAATDTMSDEQAELDKRLRKGIDPDDFSVEGAYANVKAIVGMGPNKQLAESELRKGETLFKQEKYREAVEHLEVAAARWKDSTIEEDALFLLGECYFFTDQYAKAHDAYGNLLGKYTNSRYLDTVARRQFALGQYWEKRYEKNPSWPITPNLTDKTRPRFDTFGHAIEAYQRVRLYDPTGPLADDSVMAVANAYFVRGRFEAAAYNYDLLRREYPNSKHQAEAHLLGLQAKKQIYQGAQYDGDALKDARQIADQALMQFNGELTEEQQRLKRNRQELIEQQAMRDFAMAQFYETKRYYGASRFYYNKVIDGFPRSKTADKARQRLEAIKDYPDEPTNHFKWLTDLFPEKK